MDFSQLKAHLSSITLHHAYVVYGGDAFLRQSAVNMFKARIKSPAFNYAAIEGDNTQAAAKNLSLLAWGDAERLVVVSEPKKNNIDFYINYLSSPNNACVLVLVFSENAPPPRLLKVATAVECNRLDEKYIKQFLSKKGEASGVAFSPIAVMRLIDYCGGDMAAIDSQADKLIAYAGSGIVGDQMVEELVEPQIEYKVFELSECLGKQDAARAMRVLGSLSGGGAEPTMTLGVLIKHFRRALHLSLHPNADISGELGIKPFAVTKLREQVRRFSQVRLKRITDILYSCEFDIKNGKTEAGDALALAVLKIINT